LQKNQTTLVAKIIISGQFSNFREKLLWRLFSPNFVGLTPAPRGRLSPICEKIQLS
jgi:retron-type reverse transcriptase